MKYKCPQCDIEFTKNEGADPICPICGRDVESLEQAARQAIANMPTEELDIDWSALDNLIPSARELPSRLPRQLVGSKGPAPFQLRRGTITSPAGERHQAAALYVADETTTRLGLYIDNALAIKTTWRKGSLPPSLDGALQEIGWADLLHGEQLNLTAREVFLADQDAEVYADYLAHRMASLCD